MCLQTKENYEEFEDFVHEMKQLAYSAGAEILETFIQSKSYPDTATFIGKGKVDEIKEYVENEEKPDVVIVLNDLKPSQEKNLSTALGVRVIDRQALILDIFAQRARTREGKMQVELALLKYLLPRLAGLGKILSRLGGGIGTRGPGETMLETDKRHVRKRIETLTRDLQKVRSHRGLLRESRYNKGFLTAALVGYTNSGKSTILNLLTNQKVDVQDKLFATLDPTVGKFYIGMGIELLLVDTVGFIRHLPHQLAAAFRATLEEVEEADIIIQVVDISHENWKEHLEVTETVLEEMGCDSKPTILVFNKKDMLSSLELETLHREYSRGIFVSAKENDGFEKVKEKLQKTTREFFPKFVERFRKMDDSYWMREYSTTKND